MTRSARPMTPVEVTARWQTRRGREEAFEARSRCGQWVYIRVDDHATLWTVLHVRSGQALHDAYSTLSDAREGTASGWALGELRREAARLARHGRTAQQRDEACQWLATYDADDQAAEQTGPRP